MREKGGPAAVFEVQIFSRRRPCSVFPFVFFLLLSAGILAAAAPLFAEPAAGDKRSSEPVRVGVSLSLTGAYAEPSRMMHRAYRLWEREVNAGGGLLGRPVLLKIVDDGSDPETAVRAYKEFLDEDQVDLVLSPYGTPITNAVAKITEERGCVLIAAAAAGTEIWEQGHSRLFGMYSQADRFFIGFLDLCARNGICSLSIVYEKNSFNREAANGAHLWAGRMGLSAIYLHGFDPERDDIEELWDRVEEKNSRALVLCSYPPAGHALLHAITAAADPPKAVAMTITPIDPSFNVRAGSAAEGVFAPSNWEPNERMPFPGSEKFISDFRDYSGRDPTYHAASAFSSCRILQEAVEMTGGFDHDEIRNYISILDTVTIFGRFKVDRSGKQIGHNTMTIQWQDGKKEIVYPPSVRTAEPRF
jgi:branched-chain amino acid transport system substrate-binding protein